MFSTTHNYYCNFNKWTIHFCTQLTPKAIVRDKIALIFYVTQPHLPLSFNQKMEKGIKMHQLDTSHPYSSHYQSLMISPKLWTTAHCNSLSFYLYNSMQENRGGSMWQTWFGGMHHPTDVDDRIFPKTTKEDTTL